VTEALRMLKNSGNFAGPFVFIDFSQLIFRNSAGIGPKQV
jgi:hypothetical protein